MVHQGLRVCEESRRVEGGGGWLVHTKGNPRVRKEGGGCGFRGASSQTWRYSSSSVGTTAKLNPSAHIAHPSWSPVKVNMLSRCLTD